MKVTSLITLAASRVKQGRALSETYGLSHTDASEQAFTKQRQVEAFVRIQVADSPFIFLLNDEGLALAQLRADQFLSIRADFYNPTVSYRRHKGGGKGQMIAKAVGLASGNKPTVLDATAGLGRDAFVLASLGCRVTLTERVPEVRALLVDALAQAKGWGAQNDPELIPILERMQLIEVDAITYMRELAAENAPDVIYLDPMFPLRNKSAQVKKEMRVFHDLVGSDPDAAELLSAAMTCARKRVVVKRPRTAPALSTDKPSYSLEGKSNRFDVYVCGATSIGSTIETINE